MDRDNPVETTGVIICGGGPTGGLLSALLGRMNVPNVVLERAAEITTDPRGIALDEDGIRLLQAIGMYDRVFTRIALCQDMKFISGHGHDLMKSPFLQAKLGTSEGGTGHVGFVFHKQPEMERAIRDAVDGFDCCDFRTEATLSSIEEDESSVTVTYQDSQGQRRKLRAPFLVGADGKTGFVRKQYLEPKGILMEPSKGTDYNEIWVAINWHLELPTRESHPDFPLWSQGYTSQQVYNLFFPEHFRFLCNPSRPAVCGRFGLPSDRLWRFEFVVQAGEDPETMATQDEIAKIIYPYLTHDGRRYGLDGTVMYPTDCITTLRSRPFSFSARSCNKWSLGRVALAGDAAHQFPPFGGQGIASGFRDSAALAWRLAMLHREPALDHERILQAWYTERKQQFDTSLAVTVRNGEFVTNGNPIKAFVRDWMLWSVQLIPSWRRQLERGPRDAMTRYKHEKGLPFLPEYRGGLQLPQVFAWDLAEDKVVFTDDLLFPVGKRGLLQVLVLLSGADEVSESLEAIRGASDLTNGKVWENEATVLIHDFEAKMDLKGAYDGEATIARIATGAELAADPDLSRNRLPPEGYDAFRLWREVGRPFRFVVVRPDRFIYAACRTSDELRECLQRLEGVLHGDGDAGASISARQSKL